MKDVIHIIMTRDVFVQEAKRFAAIIMAKSISNTPKDVAMSIRMAGASQLLLACMNRLAHAYLRAPIDVDLRRLHATSEYIARLGVEIGFCHPICVLGAITSLCITIMDLVATGHISSIEEGLQMTDPMTMTIGCADHTAIIYDNVMPDESLIEIEEIAVHMPGDSGEKI